MDGLACGEKVVHTTDPERRDEHLNQLTSARVDVIAARRNGSFELRSWTETHLRDGRYDQDRTLAFFQVTRDGRVPADSVRYPYGVGAGK
jgi:MEDS: MEthanogen/methylotroph, DcmR Sensory domain